MFNFLVGTTTSYDNLLPAIEFIFTLITKCFQYIMDNPILAIYIVAAILGVAITVFALLKGAAH